MDKTTQIVETYLDGVGAVLSANGRPREEVANTIAVLREHIDESLSAGVAADAVIAGLDAPEAYAPDVLAPAAPRARGIRFDMAGLALGAAMFVTGFILVPNIAPGLRGSLAHPLIVLSAVVLLCSGIAYRRSKPGLISMMMGIAILALIAATSLAT